MSQGSNPFQVQAFTSNACLHLCIVIMMRLKEILLSNVLHLKKKRQDEKESQWRSRPYLVSSSEKKKMPVSRSQVNTENVSRLDVRHFGLLWNQAQQQHIYS